MTPSAVLIGIDVGTTAAKAVALDLEGRVLRTARRSMRWMHTADGVEIDPEAFVVVALAVAHAALAGLDDVPVVGLGVAGIGETGVLIDSHGRPVGPCIAWHDTRAAGYATRLGEDLGEERFAAVTGLPVAGNWSMHTYGWLRDRVPAARSGRHWLSVPDWIVRRLGGERVNELSQASRTGFVDVRDGTVDADMLSWARAPADLLGPLVVAGTAAGSVSAEHPRLAGATLTAAGHDHLCACVGAGVTRPGEVLDSCGTAEAIVTSAALELEGARVQELAARGITTGRHVMPGRRAMLSAALSGLGLSRLLTLAGQRLPVDPGLDRKAAESREIDPPARVRIDPDGTAHILELRGELGPPELLRVAADAAAGLTVELIDGLGEPAVRRVVAVGGWSRSLAVRRAKRARMPSIEFASVEEPGARGAALLAGIASGVLTQGEAFGPEAPLAAGQVLL